MPLLDKEAQQLASVPSDGGWSASVAVQPHPQLFIPRSLLFSLSNLVLLIRNRLFLFLLIAIEMKGLAFATALFVNATATLLNQNYNQHLTGVGTLLLDTASTSGHSRLAGRQVTCPANQKICDERYCIVRRVAVTGFGGPVWE